MDTLQAFAIVMTVIASVSLLEQQWFYWRERRQLKRMAREVETARNLRYFK